MKPRHLTFHYTLKDARGRLLDTSRGGDPMPCIEGTGQVIDGLAEALGRMAAGDKRAVVVPPERAYGQRDAELVQRVPRAQLPVADLKVGDQFQTGPERSDPIVTILAVEGNVVLLDGNHPLAGQALHFEVELMTARPATPEELRRVETEITD